MKSEELKDRLIFARKRKGLSQSQIAEKVGMSQPSYYKIENGLTQRSGYINEIAKVLEVDVDWLLTGKGSMLPVTDDVQQQLNQLGMVANKDDVLIPLYSTFFCYGDGCQVFDFEDVKGYRKFDRKFFTDIGVNPNEFKLVCAINDSMRPYINNGDEVGVAVNQVEVVDGQVYALLLDGERMFKRVFREAGGALRLSSYNPSYPDRIVTADNHDSLRIVGRQVYRAG